jgi:hypothetical protein
MDSAWFGQGAVIKQRALDTALLLVPPDQRFLLRSFIITPDECPVQPQADRAFAFLEGKIMQATTYPMSHRKTASCTASGQNQGTATGRLAGRSQARHRQFGCRSRRRSESLQIPTRTLAGENRS